MESNKLSTAERSWNLLHQELKNYFNYVKSRMQGEIKVLEIGCGKGDLIKSLAAENPSAYFVGLDIDKNVIKQAKEGKLKNLEFICIDFFKFNSDKAFDIVLTAEVLEHIEKPENFVQKIGKITKKDGFLIISTPNDGNYPKKVFNFILGRKAEKIKEEFHKKNKKKEWKDKGHISVQGTNELKKKLEKAAFRIIKQTRNQPLYGGKWVDENFIFRNTNIIIDKILPRHHFINFGWNLVFFYVFPLSN